MVVAHTAQINANRLRKELDALGMDSTGPRSELISRLHQAGVYELHTDVEPPAKKLDRLSRYPNHSCILIGNGAKMDEKNDNVLIISNDVKNTNFVEGHFDTDVISMPSCIQIRETQLNAETEGKEGDIRRMGSDIYIYREDDEEIYAGWYPIKFGPVLIL